MTRHGFSRHAWVSGYSGWGPEKSVGFWSNQTTFEHATRSLVECLAISDSMVFCFPGHRTCSRTTLRSALDSLASVSHPEVVVPVEDLRRKRLWIAAQLAHPGAVLRPQRDVDLFELDPLPAQNQHRLLLLHLYLKENEDGT